MDPLSLCRIISWVAWVVLWGACSLLVVTWRLFLTNRYLREGLEREQQRHTAIERALLNSSFKQCNGLQRSLLESFLREPTPTLHNLVESTEKEWRARRSTPPSPPRQDWTDDTDPTMDLRTSDLRDLTRR
jgi:hypothetical protein